MKKLCLLFCFGEKSFLLGFPLDKCGSLFLGSFGGLVGSRQDRLSLASVTRQFFEQERIQRLADEISVSST